MKLKINDVARCLQLPLNTVERWVRQGRIPVQKDESGLIFEDSIIEKWAASHNLPFTRPQKERMPPQSAQPKNLLAAMKRGGVFYNVKGNDVPTVLKAAVDNITILPESLKAELYERLYERENLTSTGIGKGVAIPHPHDPLANDMDDPLICTCFLERPVDFAAIDDQPVFVLFILISPTIKIHLHLLSKLSFCLRNNAFVGFLKTSPDTDAFFSKIDEFEGQFDRAENHQ